MIVRFACGHRVDLNPETEQKNARCPECGEHRISRVMAPNPRVRGECSSPLKQ